MKISPTNSSRFSRTSAAKAGSPPNTSRNLSKRSGWRCSRADVNFKVVKQFTESLKTKALGQEVLGSLSPGQQVIKIVRDELVELLGGETARLNLASQPPSVLMLVGLQGSGKTTSSGKLARWLGKQGHRPMLVSVDVYRPAAREQLKVIAAEIGVPIWEGKPDEKPLGYRRGLSGRRETRPTTS